MPSEFDFIQRIRQQATRQASPAGDLVFGIGDDAAIWREQTGRETLITVDLLVEGVDFKLEYAPPRWLGHKTLAVSLSDIAAMGGAPKFALLTLAIPPHLKAQISNSSSELFWEEFFAGYFALAERHGVQLVGGDISSAPDRLTMDSIVIGQCAAGKAVRRDGAKAGDAIYVTGRLGASAAGLKLLLAGSRVDEGSLHRGGAEQAAGAPGEKNPSAAFSRSQRPRDEQVSEESRSDKELKQSAIRAHLRPTPRVELGRKLGQLGLANSMIDVSDGLAQDLAHICENSGICAILDFDAVPVAEEVELVAADNESAFDLAVSGGEDFELLLTAPPDAEGSLLELAAGCQLRLTRIGEVISVERASPTAAVRSLPARVLLRRDGGIKPLSIRGYDHFAAA